VWGFLISEDTGAVWMAANILLKNAHFRWKVIVENAFSDAAVLRVTMSEQPFGYVRLTHGSVNVPVYRISAATT
jgi:hypothetical protein